MLDISLQSALWTQILCCTRFSQDITSHYVALIAEVDLLLNPVESEDYLEEVELVFLMHAQVINPVTNIYFDQETAIGDIFLNNDEADHYYGIPRNRSIDALVDYNARR